jgi:DNA-binding CsgD family transcriptional regulator
MPTSSKFGLLGRHTECAALEELLSVARAGRSQVLVLRGAPGCGKTALLGYLSDHVRGWRSLAVSGVESEMELTYSGLHQLCMPLTERLDRLPAPQRDALSAVFGMSSHAAPDRFLVALATLTLLGDAAEDEPLVCAVDDIQWLDPASAQVLAFVARRLFRERVALVCAARTGAGDAMMAGFPELHIGSLGENDARALLMSNVLGPLDVAVVDQIVAESRGNPRALLDLPRMWSTLDVAGGYNLPDSRPSSSEIEQRYAQKLAGLPADTQLLLAVAAADPLGDPGLFERAATELGIHLEAAAPAIDAELITIVDRVQFTQPLARSAVYRASTRDDRQRAHRALADATDADADPDRRAWHRARAMKSANEIVASELHRSAWRAEARGGLAATAAFLARSADLTPNAVTRAERALAAAAANLDAGGFDEARRMLSIARDGRLTDDEKQARIELMAAQLAFAASRRSDAPPLLLAAARRLEGVDVGLACAAYRDAVLAALLADGLSRDTSVEIARAAQTARHCRPADLTATDLLLDGLIGLADDYGTAVSACKAALGMLCDNGKVPPDQLRQLWQGTVIALEIWDDQSAYVLSQYHVENARSVGALGELALGLTLRTPLLALAGEFSEAIANVAETQAVEEAIGIGSTPGSALTVAALQGRSGEARHLIQITVQGARSRGEGIGVAIGEYAWAVLCNGSGHYEEAVVAAQRASGYREVVAENLALPELVEAASRLGRRDLASNAVDRLAAKTQASGTDWALGVETRSRALISSDESTEDLYRESISRLGRTHMQCDLARAHLLYGEWLRRSQRTRDAKRTLTIAYEMFVGMTMDGFAERARRELLAVGTRVQRRDAETPHDLTPQEAQIARLAENGLSNVEIAAQMFLSSRTVEWHLRKVFMKLGISSRRELRSADEWRSLCPADRIHATVEAG